jgi:predicted RNase H-like HicB family nuclease
MKLSVTNDRDEDRVWVVECPSIPGCVSQGKTKEQGIKNIEAEVPTQYRSLDRQWRP